MYSLKLLTAARNVCGIRYQRPRQNCFGAIWKRLMVRTQRYAQAQTVDTGQFTLTVAAMTIESTGVTPALSREHA